MFCACFFFVFICQLTFSNVRQPTFSKPFHMKWLQPYRKRCYADFLKCPLTKPPKFRVEPQSIKRHHSWCGRKTENNSVHQWLFAYTFTKFGSVKHGRRSTCQIIGLREWENFAIFDIISRYISVTVQDSSIHRCWWLLEIGEAVKIFKQITEFWKFYRKGSFFPKNAKISHKISTSCDYERLPTTQWLQMAGNSLPNDPSRGCLVSTFTVRINSKSIQNTL